MKIKFMVAATLMAALVTTTSCGNSNKQRHLIIYPQY